MSSQNVFTSLSFFQFMANLEQSEAGFRINSLKVFVLYQQELKAENRT